MKLLRRSLPVVVLLVVAVACASPAPPAVTVGPGVPVSDDGLTMTVVRSSIVSPLSADYPWGTWFVVDLDVSSGDKTVLFNAMAQELFIDGRSFDPNPEAAEYVNEHTVSGASLSPHTAAAVTLAFNVSKATYTTDSTVELVLRGDIDSPGIGVAIPGSALKQPG